MKNKNILTVILFCGFIAVFFIAHLLCPDKAFSENENRTLEKLPSFSLQALFDGEFTPKYETYVNDQFPLRNGWIGLKTLVEKALLKSDTNGVYFAKDDYIIEKFSSYNKEQFENNSQYIVDFANKYDFPVYNLLIPTAGTVLTNKLPPVSDEVNQNEIIKYFDKFTGNGFININTTDTLKKHNSEDIYYRTDHHYTSLGAYYCYEHLMNVMGETPISLPEFNKEILTDNFYGTLYSKLALSSSKPEYITAYTPNINYTVEYNMDGVLHESMYENKYLETKDKYSVFLNANQSLSVIRTDNKNDKKLLLIKDSYANTLIQFLIPHYEEIHVIDLRYFKMPMSQYLSQNMISEALILYSVKNFCEDTNIYTLSR